MNNTAKHGREITREQVAAELAQFNNPDALMSRLLKDGALSVDVFGASTDYAYEDGRFYRY